CPRVTPGVIRISSILCMRKRPVCSTQSSINGSRRACSASDSERYAPSTMRQYSRTSLDLSMSIMDRPPPAGLSGDAVRLQRLSSHKKHKRHKIEFVPLCFCGYLNGYY